MKAKIIINFKTDSSFVQEEIDPIIQIDCSDDFLRIFNGFHYYLYPMQEIDNIQFKEIV